MINQKRDIKINKELDSLRKNAEIDISDADFWIIKSAVCGLVERIVNGSDGVLYDNWYYKIL